MIKIIFLDIDGVLNGYGPAQVRTWQFFQKIGLGRWYKKHRRDPFGVHPEKVRRLAGLIRKTGARIVMSSSWRHGYWQRDYGKLSSREKQLHDLFEKSGIEVMDITPARNDGRDMEIKEWLLLHAGQVENWIILDDESAILGNLACDSHFIQTSSVTPGQMITGKPQEKTGLKRKHVKAAIKILNERSRACTEKRTGKTASCPCLTQILDSTYEAG